MTQRKSTNYFFCLLFGCTRHTLKSELIFCSVVLSQFLLVDMPPPPPLFPGKWTSSSGTFPADLNYPCSPINCSGSVSISVVQVLLSQIWIKSGMYRKCRIRLLILNLAFGFTFEVVVFRAPANAWRWKSFSWRHRGKKIGSNKEKVSFAETVASLGLE